MLKNAIKYGMTPKEFWHSDINDYYAYEIAYVEKLHETTHLQGYYNYIALQTIFSNMFRKDGEKVEHYPKQNLYIEFENNNGNSNEIKQEKPKNRELELEIEFRKKMMMFY